MQHTKYNQEEELLRLKNLNRYFSILTTTIIVTFMLGILTFGDSFSLIDDPYSDLGRFWTYEGELNILSGIIFAGGLIFSAITCFRIEKKLRGRYNSRIFKVCGLGFLLMIAPADLFNIIHVLGVIIVFGSLWIFSISRLRELRPVIGIQRFFSYQLLLNGTVLPYAFLYFTGNSARHLFQKLAMAGIIATIIIVGIELRKAIEREHNKAKQLNYPLNP
ncbi:MAG: hypothetical protein ACOCZL_06140 [Bacteroidota bacterium]